MYKFRKIRFDDHPILGNLCLDFCDKAGNAVDTVILAGENGVGKSSVIEALYEVASHSINHSIEVEIEKDGTIVNISYSPRAHRNGVTYLYANDHLGMNVMVGSTDLKNRYPFCSIFSDVDINFHAGDISGVTALTLDSTRESRRSDTDLPRQINQLLIDIQALDDAELAFAARQNRDTPINALGVSERMPRFTNAFNSMFDALRYSRTTNEENKKTIMFQKNGVDIPISGLSSGEKQIVYRGCFLLKDVNAMNGAFVFIDEPEISLHPNWQKRIMDYYRGIFTDENGVQTSQIFAVTHSPFVIHNENRRNDKVIILARDKEGTIVVSDKPEYYRVDSIEAVKDAFSIEDFSATRPTVYLEGRTDEKYFRKALEVFGISVPFEFKWVGHLDDKGQEANTGKDALSKAAQFLYGQNLSAINVCLFDCDTNRTVSQRNKIFIRVLPTYQNTKKMKKGIENALVLDNIDLTRFYTTKTKEGDYGDDNTIVEFNKMECCDYICGLDDNTLKSVFANLKTEIDSLAEVYKEK